MTPRIDFDDPKYAAAAAEILRRHDEGAPEANITSAVRDFLILTGLAESQEIVEEAPPAQGSRQAVDLSALNTFIEFKRRIGSASGFDPNSKYVEQLDDYLTQSQEAGRGIRMGVLTDGRHWLLRWPNAGAVQAIPPYAFTLESADRWIPLFEWLRDTALASRRDLLPEREVIAEAFGPNSPRYERDISALRELFRAASGTETVQVKRRLWRDLLLAALGEIASTPEELDDLFVRHTYLSAVIGMVVQTSFGIDIYQLSRSNPSDLLLGRRFQQTTGLSGIIESDFFAWPSEVGGQHLVKAVADRVARFNWRDAPGDIAAILYETVIPPDERRQLGEYYTPHWLARTMVREVVTDPLKQHVLDPACGSGTFVAEAVTHLLAAAQTRLDPVATLNRLQSSVTGIDVHPVAVHLARAAWVLAAKPAIERATDAGYNGSVSVPVHLGDALQLRFRADDLFSAHEVRVEVGDELNTSLAFPVSLVERANDFDALMGDVADAVESGNDPLIALDDHGMTDTYERTMLEETAAKLQRLHTEGRNHIWAYYTRNLVRPVVLSRRKVDVIIGNPPWLIYRNTASTLRAELERQSKDVYGIWAGGKHANHQDISSLFFARCTDLYLKNDGMIGMVMPHSALRTGQYSKWRSGDWHSKPKGRGRNRSSDFTLLVDFSIKSAWDLERLQPNTFFPVAASVVFARRIASTDKALAVPLVGIVERWQGKAGAPDVRRVPSPIADMSVGEGSPYAGYSRNGATIYPRCLFFVSETDNPAIVRAGQTVTVNPRRGSQDKDPWRSLDLASIAQQTVEASHIFDVHLGETLVPYATLDPLKAILPLRRSDSEIPIDSEGSGGIRLGGLERRMRDRWRIVSGLWEDNKAAANNLDLLGQLDYFGKLSAQLDWQRIPGERRIRVVYAGWGAPTAAILTDDDHIVDYKLFWISCKDFQEANYLLAIINSEFLAAAVNQYTTPNWAGKTRDLQKHLWKLPIPEFDQNSALHRSVAEAGEAATTGAVREVARLHAARDRVTVTIARRELRKWLQSSPEGQAVEYVVAKLLP